MTLKPIQVRLPAEVYRALRNYAAVHHLTLGGAAAALMRDSILGRSRGLPDVEEGPQVAGFVYIIKVGDLCKIGKAKDVRTRLRELHLPSEPELIVEQYSTQPFALERELHERFARFRGRGEWFRLGPAEIETARSLLNGER